MPPFGAIKRQDLMRYLRDLGFEGPYVGGKHQHIVKDKISWLFPILIGVTSVEISWPGFYGKQGLRGASGKLSK
jgi:hypothetical protein